MSDFLQVTSFDPLIITGGGAGGGSVTPESIGAVSTTDARLSDNRTPVDGSVTDAKVAANAAISADKLADGSTNKVYSAADKARLANTSGTNTGDQVNVTGNAGTASKLQNGRLINGVLFDGTANITVYDSTKIQAFNMTATQTANYNAAAWDLAMMDATSGGITAYLPNAPADKTRCAVKKAHSDVSANAVTVHTSGTDVFDTGLSSYAITYQDMLIEFEYQAGPNTWVPIGRYFTVSSLGIPVNLTDLNGTLGYSQLAPGAQIGINWNGTGWVIGATAVTSRPTARTDVVCHFIGGTTAPSFGLAGVDIWDQDLS